MKKLSASLFAALLALAIGPSSDQTLGGNSPRLLSCTLKQLPASSRHRSKAAPHIHISEGTSLNWSGYAAVAGSLTAPETDAVTAVGGYWTVPQVTGSAGDYSALWVGIDGYADGTVEQLGTEQDVVNVKSGHKVVTTVQNYAWFEMYPAGSFEILNFPVNPGDVIGAGVVYDGANVFTLAITNVTRNAYFIVPASYSTSSKAERSSAEWIAEAPSSGGVLPLADFGTVAFAGCSATINGDTGTIGDFVNDPLTMATAATRKTAATAKAVPSALSPDGSSFTVTWRHD